MVDQQTLIYLNLLFLVVIVLFFWTGKSKDKTSKLNLGGKAEVGSSQRKMALSSQGPQYQKERNLGVIFNYNGHQWEAYQVLGVPAGSPLQDCLKAHQSFCKQADGQAQLYDLALQAIRESLQSSVTIKSIID